MAFDVALTFAQRDSLYSLQQTSALQDRTQRRLASGREVNDVTDDVFRYFAARALSEHADELLEYNEGTEQAVSSIKTALSTIESVRELFKQIKGIVQGSGGKTGVELAALNKPLEATLQQAGNLLVDGQYQGTRFLISQTEKLDVRFSNRFTLEVSSTDFFATSNLTAVSGGTYVDEFINISTGLGEVSVILGRLLASVGTNNASNFGLENTSGRGSAIGAIVERLNSTIRALNNRAQSLGTYVGILQVRLDYTSAYTKELKTGTDSYTLADINQEGAYLVSLTTRQQLALNGLAVSGRQQNAVLTLLQ